MMTEAFDSPAVLDRYPTTGPGRHPPRRLLLNWLAQLITAESDEDRVGPLARLATHLPTDPAALGDLLRPGHLKLVAAWLPTHRQGALRALLVGHWCAPYEYQMIFNLLLDTRQELPLADPLSP